MDFDLNNLDQNWLLALAFTLGLLIAITITLIAIFIIRRFRNRAKIFISYRRADSKSISDSIYRTLANTFGESNVFLDRSEEHGITAGDKWKETLQAELHKSSFLLVIIGPAWEKIINDRATSSKDDFVRFEVEMGLNRGRTITIIPTCVRGAPFPTKVPNSVAGLLERQKIDVRDEPDFEEDMIRLIKAIRKRKRTVNYTYSISSIILLTIFFSPLINLGFAEFLPPVQSADPPMVETQIVEATSQISLSPIPTVIPFEAIESVEIREAPGMQFDVLMTISGEEFRALIDDESNTGALSDDGTWLSIFLEDGQVGWIAVRVEEN